MPQSENEDGDWSWVGSLLLVIVLAPFAIAQWAYKKLMIATGNMEPDGELKDTRELYNLAVSATANAPRKEAVAIATDLLSEIAVDLDKLPDDEVATILVALVRGLAEEACICTFDNLQPPDSSFLSLDISDRVLVRKRFTKIAKVHNNYDEHMRVFTEVVGDVCTLILSKFPARPDENSVSDFSLMCSALDMISNPHQLINVLSTFVFDEDVKRLGMFESSAKILSDNIDEVTGKSTAIIYATDKTQLKLPARDVAFSYLKNTLILDLLLSDIELEIPLSSRFEHTHVLGGTGHGKTQFLQSLILKDLQQALEGKGSVVVIDGQGDLIKNIVNLSYFDPDVEGSLADKLLLVDPNDIDYPTCLNMFDINQERLNGYSPIDRERIFNATIDLYEYIFGALLGAEMTQKQDVIFKYLARLMFAIPDATIHTLLDVMENGESYQPYIDTLDETSQRFYRTQFFNKDFDDTKQQIARRLWGILSNGTIERMFNNKRNKVDIFEAINEGKIVLIDTAKDLLQTDGSAILGRFFIALIVQAAIQRQTIPEDRRRSTFVYIDEIQDYIQGDNRIEELLNQARKYKVGILGAHQNLDQLSNEQRATFASSTTTKFVGGLSAKDAKRLGDDMRCDPDFLLSMRKTKAHASFACFVRNVTPTAIKVDVPFGQMESIDRISPDAYQKLIAQNRARYSASSSDVGGSEKTSPDSGAKAETGEFSLGDHDVI